MLKYDVTEETTKELEEANMPHGIAVLFHLGSRQSSQSLPKTLASGQCLFARRPEHCSAEQTTRERAQAIPYIREECQEAPGIPSMDANLVQDGF